MTMPSHTLSTKGAYVLVERPQDYEVVLSEQADSLAEISSYCAQAGRDKVMIVGPRTKVRLSVLDVFDLGEQIAEMGLQVAVVETHDTEEENIEFLECVASTRGTMLHFFDNQEEAIHWLESSSVLRFQS